MILPLLLLILSSLASVVLAYGTHPVWARFDRGMQIILMARHYQWPIMAMVVLPALALMGLVVAGKRRLWWLIGLGPIAALLGHRLYNDPYHGLAVLDNPDYVSIDQAGFLSDSDYVVGVTYGDRSYAYPYWSLYRAPVIFQSDHDRRMVLIWSAFANRATAFNVTRDLHARDLEIVSMPANSLLIYNTKLGQFIHGITGRKPDGSKPTGFGAPVPTQKLPWSQWKAAHPNTLVLAPADSLGGKIPSSPSRPMFPQPRRAPLNPNPTRILIVAATQPVALPADKIPDRPLNFMAGQTPVLLFRDPQTAKLKAFDRHVEDFIPRFDLNTDRRRQGYLVDRDSRSGWSADGKAASGRFAEEKNRLAPVLIEDGLYWEVMKLWFPDLPLLDPGTIK